MTILLMYRRDQSMIALLSGVVMVLIICHLPKTVINIYESYQVNCTNTNNILLNDPNF